jgi:small GTP-binding protein
MSRSFKTVFLGETGVGKTALVNQITNHSFPTVHHPTIGSQFITIPITIGGDECAMQLWDTGGQEQYRSLAGFFVRDAVGCFLVFDVANQDSFDQLEVWQTFLIRNAPQAKVILFGNKTDLIDERTVQYNEAEQFARANECLYLEGSACTGDGIEGALVRMVEMLRYSKDLIETDQRGSLDQVRPRSGICC